MNIRLVAFLAAVGIATATSSGASAQTDDDIESLKAQVEQAPDDIMLRGRLGRAYFLSGNDFWAAKTLRDVLDRNPDDCEARVWLGMALLRRAFPDEALSVVRHGGCEGPALLRLKMLEALVLGSLGQAEAADRMLTDAVSLDQGYREDIDALPAVRSMVNPMYTPEVIWMLEAGGGYTSNAAMGSATDSATGGTDAASAMTTVDARVRLSPDFGGPVRGVFEVQPRFQWFFGDSAKPFSYFQITGQAGIQIRSTLPRVFLGYRPDYLVLLNGFRGETGPVPYMSAHRGEFEIEVLPEVLIFGGAGTRTFAEMVKSRTEVDLGLGGFSKPVGNLTILWAASGRWYDARHPAWDLAGGSATFAAVMQMPHDLVGRASTTLSVDWYPHSAASGDIDPFGTRENRLDYLFKVGGQFWSPSLSGVRFVVSYDFSSRESTADAYSYTDHRVMLKVRWNGSASFRRPSLVPLDDQSGAIDWGTGDAGGLDERVQDMLRQDEQVQRSSSCAN